MEYNIVWDLGEGVGEGGGGDEISRRVLSLLLISLLIKLLTCFYFT